MIRDASVSNYYTYHKIKECLNAQSIALLRAIMIYLIRL